MNIILLENIEKVGLKYEVVTVKAGYGRNYLIPQGLALTANRQNLGKLSGIKRQQSAKDNLLLDTYKVWASSLEGKSIRFVAKAGDSGRLFGSITSNMMAEKFAELGVPVERRKIIMPAEVKQLGAYEVKLDLHSSLDVRVPFEVVSESDDMVSARAAAASPVAEGVEAAAPFAVETVAAAAAPVAIAAAVAEPSVIETVVETVSDAAETVSEKASEIATDIAEAAAPVVETVSETAETVVEKASDIIDDVAEAAAPVLESVSNFFSDAVDSVSETIADAVDSVKESASDVVEEIKDKEEEA